jgi:putative Holliday junction resolvase
MRILGIDYGDARVGVAITDPLLITAQGLETIHHKGNDKIVLKRLEEIINQFDVTTIVIGMPFNMNGSATERVELTEKFIHKLKCKFNKINIETMDERLTTVSAHKTMNILNVNKRNKRNIVDTISAEYILESYLKRSENKNEQ